MVLEKLIDFIGSVIGADTSDFDEDTLLRDVVSDETEAAELALAIESEYEVELEELDGDMTLLALAEFIESESEEI